METAHKGKIGPHLGINFILFYIGAVGACTVSITQPRYLEVDLTYKTVTIDCTFSKSGCPSAQTTSLWFRHGVQQPENLCLNGCRSEADKFTVREVLAQNQVSLTINRVTSNDSAIYICGIAVATHALAPGAKQTGDGTMLVVRESKLLSREVRSLLTALLALLSIYIAGVCVIFIIFSKAKSNILRNKKTKEDPQKKSARRIFQEIAQELYHKRYVGRSQQPQSLEEDLPEKENNTYENRSTLSYYERP